MGYGNELFAANGQGFGRRDQGQQLFARDIQEIDLRMADRMTVQLAPDVLEDVEDAVTRARRPGGTP